MAVRHQGHHHLTAQHQISCGTASGDDENALAVVAFGLDHDARLNAAKPLTVEVLAARAHMSPRTFARHFRAHTGTTPYAWLLSQRIRLAERMLESGGLPVDEVARRSGFGSAAGLREHFIRERGVSPQAYRRTFRTAHGL